VGKTAEHFLLVLAAHCNMAVSPQEYLIRLLIEPMSAVFYCMQVWWLTGVRDYNEIGLLQIANM
jgi:hypothetical protein